MGDVATPTGRLEPGGPVLLLPSPGVLRSGRIAREGQDRCEHLGELAEPERQAGSVMRECPLLPSGATIGLMAASRKSQTRVVDVGCEWVD